MNEHQIINELKKLNAVAGRGAESKFTIYGPDMGPESEYPFEVVLWPQGQECGRGRSIATGCKTPENAFRRIREKLSEYRRSSTEEMIALHVRWVVNHFVENPDLSLEQHFDARFRNESSQGLRAAVLKRARDVARSMASEAPQP